MTSSFNKIEERSELNDVELMTQIVILHSKGVEYEPAMNRLLDTVQNEWRERAPESLVELSPQQLRDYMLYMIVSYLHDPEKLKVIATIPADEQLFMGKFALYALYIQGKIDPAASPITPVVLEKEILKRLSGIDPQVLINILASFYTDSLQESALISAAELKQVAAGILQKFIDSNQASGTNINFPKGKKIKQYGEIEDLLYVFRNANIDQFYDVINAMFIDEKSFSRDINLIKIRQFLLELNQGQRDKFAIIMPALKHYPLGSLSWNKVIGYWSDLFSEKEWLQLQQARRLRSVAGNYLEAHGMKEVKDAGTLKGLKNRDMLDEFNDLAEQVDEESIKEEKLQKLAEEIVRDRSSGMSQDGHRLALREDESVLGILIDELKISRNKETGKPANGIACNVNFHLKNKDKLYTKLTAKGELLMRVVESSSGKELKVYAKGEQKRLSDKLFGELNRLALEKLKIIYVRQKPNLVKTVPIEPGIVFSEAVNDAELEAAEIANEVAQAVEDVVPEQLMFPEMIEQGWTEQGKESAMKLDLTEKEKQLRKQISKRERIKIESNLAKVREFFLRVGRQKQENTVGAMMQTELWPKWPELEKGSLLEISLKELVLHRQVKIDGENYYELMDPLVAYQQLIAGKLTLGEIFVRSKRAYAQALPYVLGNRKVLSADLKDQYGFWMVQRKEMSEQAKFKMQMFQSGEQGEEINLAEKEKILYFEVEDLSKNGERSFNREIFEGLSNGRVNDLMEIAAGKETSQWVDEMKESARKKYLEKDPARYEKLVKSLEKRGEKKMEKIKETLEEIRLMAKEQTNLVAGFDGEPREKVTFSLPASGFRFGQTFNQGAFKSVAELTEKGGK
jgi:hypothetical protein